MRQKLLVVCLFVVAACRGSVPELSIERMQFLVEGAPFVALQQNGRWELTLPAELQDKLDTVTVKFDELVVSAVDALVDIGASKRYTLSQALGLAVSLGKYGEAVFAF